MSGKDYTLAFTVDQTPEEAFVAINDVRGWWTGEVEGDTARLGSEFSYRVAGVHYSKQKITESVPGKEVVECYKNCSNAWGLVVNGNPAQAAHCACIG